MPHTQESPADLGRSLRFAAEVARMTLESSLDLTGYIAPEDRAEVADRLQASLDGLYRLLRDVEPMAAQLPATGAAVRFAAEVAGMTLDRIPLLLADLDKEPLLELADRLQSSLCGLHRLLHAGRHESADMDVRFAAVVAELALARVLELATPADRATREALADRLQPMLYGLYRLLQEARKSAGWLPDGGRAVHFAAAVAGMTLDRVPLLRGEMDADSQAELADHLASSLAGLHRHLYSAADDALNELAKPRMLASVEANRAPLRNPLQAPAAVG
jgi:hypothetical protein